MAKDTLAKGAKSANFGSMSSTPQKKWDDIFADFKPEKEYEVKKK